MPRSGHSKGKAKYESGREELPAQKAKVYLAPRGARLTCLARKMDTDMRRSSEVRTDKDGPTKSKDKGMTNNAENIEIKLHGRRRRRCAAAGEPRRPRDQIRNSQGPRPLDYPPVLTLETAHQRYERGKWWQWREKLRGVMCGAYVHGTDPYLPGNDV